MSRFGKRRCATLLCAYLTTAFNLFKYAAAFCANLSCVTCASWDFSNCMSGRVFADQATFMRIERKSDHELVMQRDSSLRM